MQNQNIQPWAWGQPNAPQFPTASVFPSTFSPATMENQLMTGYQQMYGAASSQPSPNYGATQWSAAQIQHWQQWQQWQEKYQQWQAQYGKKYAETIAALGQSPSLVLPGIPALPGTMKPNEIVNVGYTTANPPPPPSNAQPVPPPPPEEEKQSSALINEKNESQSSVSDVTKENPEELSEAEKTFDIQFKQWEDQFNEWKKQNQDHPDKAQYREYEKKWETWREQLLQRREQMRRKRLNKGMEITNDANNSGKKEEDKTKSVLEQVSVPNASIDMERIYTNAENQISQPRGSADGDPKLSSNITVENKPVILYGNQENQGIFPNQRPVQEANLINQLSTNTNQPVNFGGLFNVEGNYKNVQDQQNANRIPEYFEGQNPIFASQATFYGPIVLEENDNNIQKFRSQGVENNRGKDLAGIGSRFGGLDNSVRPDQMHRRAFGNGNFEDDRNERNFGQRFSNFDNRKSKDFAQDRFIENRSRDQKFNEFARTSDFGSNSQLNEQAFNQASRNVSERNYSSDQKNTFTQIQNSSKSNINNSFSKPKVPSLFDITIVKPPGIISPSKERKAKIWEKNEGDKYFDDHIEEKKDETNLLRNDNKPWLSNAAWAKNNSPWIKPWELDRVLAEKSPDANLRSDAWQKEPLTGVRIDGSKPWASEIEKSELSGYVGNILAKLGNFNVMPPSLPVKDIGFMDEGNFQNSVKVNENLENKLQSFAQSHNWPSRDAEKSNLNVGLNPKAFSQDSLQNQNNFGLNQGKFGRERVEESSKFASQSDGGSVFMSKESRTQNFSSVADDSVLFGKGDCDERFRFDRERDNYRINDERNVFRRDDRACFQNDDRNSNSKSTSNRDDERIFGRGERNAFGRDERPGSRYNFLDDIDERIGRNRDRNGRRGVEDRDDRLFRGSYDRDDRRNRNFISPFDRNFGRNLDRGLREPEWNPQVFDYSAGNSQKNFRSRFSDSDDNFKISTVVDYSHGENKQTFDYGHGELRNDSSDIRSFDCGSSIIESPSVIDYGHGADKESARLAPWKKENDTKLNERSKSHSRSRSPQIRSRSPKGKTRSRSRSPTSLSKNKRNSNSPTFGSHQPRNRDRFNRQAIKRNRKNSSEEKSSQNTDTEVSKNNFDITTVLVEDLICSPGRETRPNKLVFIMRGLPGSGKTYVTKLIKDKELEMSGDAPRILSLDDYFMTEVEKEVIDEETGRKVKKKALEYEYEACAEPHYRGSLLKAFKKTISDGFFSFIIVDSVNEKTKDYEEMWSFAKQKGFQVYVAEMDDDITICTKRNIHKRTEKEISDIAKDWEKTPSHYLRLDVRSLLQADAITEVEMEVVSDVEGESVAVTGRQKDEDEKEDEEEDEPGESAFVGSRWDHFENSEQKLDRLDGLKRRREGFHTTMQDYLQLPDDFDIGASESTDGKKKVRWADLEERRQQEKMRAIGFVVGQTDWSRMTDPTFGESALTRTKYI